MNIDRLERTARYFHDAHRNGERFEPVPEAYRPRNLQEAYAAQDRFVELSFSTDSPPIAGYKIAVTSQVIQELVGISHPCLGMIRSGSVHRSLANLPESGFSHVGIECEIAFTLKSHLGAVRGKQDRESVTTLIESCHPAFEVLDDRHADYSKIDGLSLIADNCWCAGVVLGPAITDWQSLALEELTGTLQINGKTVGQGVTRDALGHPLEGLAWIANTLAQQGKKLEAGMIVITGSIIATEFLSGGDAAVFEVERLGRTALTLR
jgi:2-keto-4-pentenoate hydratase